MNKYINRFFTCTNSRSKSFLANYFQWKLAVKSLILTVAKNGVHKPFQSEAVTKPRLRNQEGIIYDLLKYVIRGT